jgi:nicotinate-nucleotide adenylyltransferase
MKFSTVFCEDCVMDMFKKIILFGGSFDPIHTGHVQVARHALQSLRAGRLFFVPARRSPHKTDSPAVGHHRLAMIRKAIEGVDRFSVSDCELIRPEPSYTLDTINFFREQFGNEVALYWLVGADQLSDFDRWHRVEELLRVCHVSVMFRAGYPPPDFSRLEGVFSEETIERLRRDIIQTPLIDLNSTAIRRQLAAGTLPPGALPSGVLQYIRQHHLYGCD